MRSSHSLRPGPDPRLARRYIRSTRDGYIDYPIEVVKPWRQFPIGRRIGAHLGTMGGAAVDAFGSRVFERYSNSLGTNAAVERWLHAQIALIYEAMKTIPCPWRVTINSGASPKMKLGSRT